MAISDAFEALHPARLAWSSEQPATIYRHRPSGLLFVQDTGAWNPSFIPAPSGPPDAGEFYQHFKGGIYRVEGLARSATNSCALVVYSTQIARGYWWVRTLKEWQENVGDKPRFGAITQHSQPA